MWIYLRKATGYYYVGWSNGQQSFTRSTRRRNYEEARAWAKAANIEKIEMASRLGVQVPRIVTLTFTNRDHTLKCCLESFRKWANTTGRLAPSTVHTYCLALEKWMKYNNIDQQSPQAITADDLSAYLYREDWKASFGTMHFHRSAMWKFFEYLRNEGIVPGNPAANVKLTAHGLEHSRLEPIKREPFTDEEIKLLMERLRGFHLFAAKLSLATGLRLCDAACLEWDSWVGRAKTLVIYTDKTGARVEFNDLPDDIVAMLTEFWNTRDENSPYVFPRQQAVFADPVHRARVSLTFTRKLRACGVFKKSFHCFRHTYITKRRQQGATLEQVGTEVGHRHPGTTAIYDHANH